MYYDNFCIIIFIRYNNGGRNGSMDLNEKQINGALKYATIMHKGQTRKDGTEYIYHPIRVANYLANLDLYDFEEYRSVLVICGYLHDVIEDTTATYDDVENKFGHVIADIVYGLTNDDILKRKLGKTRYLQIKMNYMTDLELIVKLSDRLDNVRDLVNSDDEFRQKYLKETIAIMNYILDNRDLNKIHMNIIKEIQQSIVTIIEIYSYQGLMYNQGLPLSNNKHIEKNLLRHW